MGRALILLLALLAGVACALAVGCGDRSNLIAPSSASGLKADLATARAAVAAGDCSAADAAVDRLSQRYQGLSRSVDSRLKKRIGDGVRALRATVPTDCKAAQTQPETQTQETQTQTQETQTQETQTDTTPAQTETTPTETQPVPPASSGEPSSSTPPAVTPDANGGTAGEAPTP